MDYHKNKYLKYKEKYMELKQLKNNNDFEGGLPWSKTFEYYKHYYNVSRDPEAIKSVPDEFLTYDIYLAAIKQDGYLIEYVLDKNLELEKNLNLVDDNMYLEAVKATGYALRYIPKERRTWAICKAAVESYYKAFEYVPKTIQDSPAFYKLYEVSRDKEITKRMIQEKGNADRYDSNNDYDRLSAAANTTRILREQALAKKW